MNQPLTITIIQTDLHWEDKTANLRMLEEKIKNIREKTEIVLLPEMFSTGFSMKPGVLAETMEGETMQWMRRVSMEKKIILAGSVIIRDRSTGSKEDQFFNRLVWMLPNGHYSVYDKRHRFAYAGEDQQYTAGHKRLISSVKGWKVNLMVCYDLRFPTWARQQTQSGSPEYDILVYVANWPDKRIHAWKTLLQARAIENQCYVVGVNRVGKDGNDINYTGNSMVVDPLGEVLYNKEGVEDIFTFTLSYDQLQVTRDKFPFWKDADRFVIVDDQGPSIE